MSKSSDILPDDEALEKETPLLHSISKENPFSVPEEYFDGLPSRIIEKCREKERSKNRGENILTALLAYKWRVLAITGCAVLICFFALHRSEGPVSYEAMAQTIPDSLIAQNLDKNISYISESTLEELQEPESATAVKPTPDSTASADQDIIAYLINNNVSVSDIVNEP